MPKSISTNTHTKRFFTVIVQSILSPFSAHNAHEHTAQVMGTKNRVANMLKHSLLEQRPWPRARKRKAQPCHTLACVQSSFQTSTPLPPPPTRRIAGLFVVLS